MARKRKGLSINGVVLLDKPHGLSSNQALQKVRWSYQAKKAGHTGALDPLATGLLPVCLGEATKFSQFLLDADKAYITRAKLGQTTTTEDAEGEVVSERPVPALTESLVEGVLTEFRGQIDQVPPMYSALKRDGQPLYKLAREGKLIDIEPRKVTILSLELMAIEGDELILNVECTKGTYIRSLVRDIGEALGCGAHVKELRRTKAGPFDISQCVTLEALEQVETRENVLRVSDCGLSAMPVAELNQEQVDDLLLGRKVKVSDQQIKESDSDPDYLNKNPTQALIRLYNVQSGEKSTQFFGVADLLPGNVLQPKRLVNMAEYPEFSA
ncbi:tRNA pseudouridine(55) synthase TruB [Litoribrevibacter albus]|uniref:tRNA pseudouridine synthase B n=1 Tax=Litoribrevibacter albus TaxID=1473156 RepID=A0AA37W6B0_9GAMM|nr:tRNA pseudouridine(55) synthase TruB [Litoribrevibacter albus]GLQ29699.1 tRNA pseudouridine synthase B [Litoribrevibacter albus]